MDFVGTGGGGGGSSGSVTGGSALDNGPILYSEPNRTSAIDDIRSVVIYIFIITIFLSFFLILPGIRNEKFPTFLCITTSLIVTSIILVSLFGTVWHVSEAPISAAYKAFSRDRIQGQLSVRIGLQSVNISLSAHKYYILHATDGPIIMDNSPILQPPSRREDADQVEEARSSAAAKKPQEESSSTLGQPLAEHPTWTSSEHRALSSASQLDNDSARSSNLADELLGERTSDGASLDPELDNDEVFAANQDTSNKQAAASASQHRRARSSQPSNSNLTLENGKLQLQQVHSSASLRLRRAQSERNKYTVKHVNVDINYNERFYWIEPNQMRQEHQNALERGLPYPILTVVEYLSQDEAGFSWSRQYRAAGYYTYIMLWLSLCVCVLMFFLHCAAPKYGIYTMQLLGCLLLLTNFTYSTLVPRGEQKLVIPFEGQSLKFHFGWNFWLVMIGGVLSLIVGSLIVILDCLFPNFIFTTILDVDFDSRNKYYRRRTQQQKKSSTVDKSKLLERPVKPPFLESNSSSGSSKGSKTFWSSSSSTSASAQSVEVAESGPSKRLAASNVKVNGEKDSSSSSRLDELFAGPLRAQVKQPAEEEKVFSQTNQSVVETQKKRNSSVLDMPTSSDTYSNEKTHLHRQVAEAKGKYSAPGSKSAKSSATHQSANSKNANLKNTNHKPSEDGQHLDVRL